MHTFHFLMCVGAFGLLACSGDDNTAATSSSNGSGGGSSSSSTATGNGDVTGTNVVTHLADTGEEDVPQSGFSVDVLVGAQTIHGTVHADGSFTIPGVPPGVFTLRVTYASGSADFITTAERAFDLGDVLEGRKDAAVAAHKTPLHVDVAGLAPWNANDEIVFYSVGADAFDFFHYDVMPAPTPGATTLLGSLDYHLAILNGLVDTTRGDKVYLTHLPTRTVDGVTLEELAKVFAPSSLTLHDGQQAMIAGTFQDVPQTSHATFHWKQTQFAALADGDFPGAVASHSLTVFAEPGGPNRASGGGLGTLVDGTAAVSADVDLTVAFGNPFPSAWGVVVGFDTVFSANVPLPGGATAAVTDFASTTMLLSDADGATIAPVVGPVSQLRLGGQPALQARTGVGSTPTVDWHAPALGSPTMYIVSVDKYDAQDQFFAPIAAIYTDQTSISIPTGVLAKGSSYRVTVTSESGFDIKAPFRSTNQFAAAVASTAGFSP